MSLKLTMTEASGFDLHEPDEWLPGTITSIEETEGQYGPGLKWIIQLDNEEWDTWAFCSQKLSPKSKLYDWLRGLEGNTQMPEPGESVDFASYIGKPVQVMFEQFDRDGSTAEKVVKIRAAKTTGLQDKQKAAAKAKKPDLDESPF